MREPTTERTQPPGASRPSRWQRISAFAFIGAFGLTVLTVILTGLEVGSPKGPRSAPDTETVSLALAEPHTVNLLFTSQADLTNVRFTVVLPTGIEIYHREGVRRIEWSALLSRGDNLLPLELVARSGDGGQLAARLQHGTSQKTFVVDVAVGAPRGAR